MNLDLKKQDVVYGYTISDYIASIPNELSRDAVGLWQIIPAGRTGFKLQGDDMIDFVRLCILSLLEHGAKPVIGGGMKPYFWLLQPQYGTQCNEIADAVIAEWVAKGASEVDPGGLWFALPTLGGVGCG